MGLHTTTSLGVLKAVPGMNLQGFTINGAAHDPTDLAIHLVDGDCQGKLGEPQDVDDDYVLRLCMCARTPKPTTDPWALVLGVAVSAANFLHRLTWLEDNSADWETNIAISELLSAHGSTLAQLINYCGPFATGIASVGEDLGTLENLEQRTDYATTPGLADAVNHLQAALEDLGDRTAQLLARWPAQRTADEQGLSDKKGQILVAFSSFDSSVDALSFVYSDRVAALLLATATQVTTLADPKAPEDTVHVVICPASAEPLLKGHVIAHTRVPDTVDPEQARVATVALCHSTGRTSEKYACLLNAARTALA